MSKLLRSIVSNLPDPALNWRWRCFMPPSLVSNPNGIIVEEVNFTHTSIPSGPRFGGGTNTYYPGFNDISGVSITFYETSKYQSLKFLYLWRSLVLDADGNYGVPNGPDGYKKTVKIESYDHKNSSSPVWVGKLKGIWPTEIDAQTLTYSSKERLQVTASFSVDSNEVDL
jgi:hypothetical protein